MNNHEKLDTRSNQQEKTVDAQGSEIITDNIMRSIEYLKKLYDYGIITKEEYLKKVHRIISEQELICDESQDIKSEIKTSAESDNASNSTLLNTTEIQSDSVSKRSISKRKRTLTKAKKRTVLISILITLIILAVTIIPIVYCVILPKFGFKKIIYDSCGGSSCVTTYTKGNEIIKLPTPRRTGCIFDGWYFNKNGEGARLTSEYFQNIPLTSDIQVYASWLKYNPTTFSSSTYSLSQTSSKYYWGIELSIFPSLKQTTVDVILNVGFFLVNNGTMVDSITDINISATVGGVRVHFNGKGVQRITINQSFLYNVPITNVYARFSFLEQVVE